MTDGVRTSLNPGVTSDTEASPLIAWSALADGVPAEVEATVDGSAESLVLLRRGDRMGRVVFNRRGGCCGSPGRTPRMRILIADDHELLRDTLVHFLSGEPGIETAVAASLPEALDTVAVAGPFDLVLLDYAMPGMEGLEGLGRMRAQPGAQPVTIISGTASREVAEQALAAGAAGFLPKTLSARSLLNAVRFMAMGEQYAPLDFMRQPVPAPAHPMMDLLSQREREVLEGLTQGKSNKEIARDLDLREPTVKLHMKTLYRKIGAANRTQAAMIAKREGLF